MSITIPPYQPIMPRNATNAAVRDEVPVGEAVDESVEPDAAEDVRLQQMQIGVANEIGRDTSGHVAGVAVGQVQVREKIHFKSFVIGHRSSVDGHSSFNVREPAALAERTAEKTSDQ